MKSIHALVFNILIVSVASLYGQTRNEFSKEEQEIIKEIAKEDTQPWTGGFIENGASHKIETLLQNPQTINYSFDALKQWMGVGDWQFNRFRVFTWVPTSGGNNGVSSTVLQYKTAGDKINAIAFDRISGFCGQNMFVENMYKLDSKGSEAYLILGYQKFGSASLIEAAYIISIAGNELSYDTLFNGMKCFTISYLSDVDDRVISYKPETQTLVISCPADKVLEKENYTNYIEKGLLRIELKFTAGAFKVIN